MLCEYVIYSKSDIIPKSVPIWLHHAQDKILYFFDEKMHG